MKSTKPLVNAGYPGEHTAEGYGGEDPRLMHLHPLEAASRNNPTAQATARGFKPIGVLPVNSGGSPSGQRGSPQQSYGGQEAPVYADVAAARALLRRPAPEMHRDEYDPYSYDQPHVDSNQHHGSPGADPRYGGSGTIPALYGTPDHGRHYGGSMQQPDYQQPDYQKPRQQPQPQPVQPQQQQQLFGSGGAPVGRRGRYDPVAAAAADAAAAAATAAQFQSSGPAARNGRTHPDEYSGQGYSGQAYSTPAAQPQPAYPPQQQQQLLGSSGSPTGRRGHYDPSPRDDTASQVRYRMAVPDH